MWHIASAIVMVISLFITGEHTIEVLIAAILCSGVGYLADIEKAIKNQQR